MLLQTLNDFLMGVLIFSIFQLIKFQRNKGVYMPPPDVWVISWPDEEFFYCFKAFFRTVKIMPQSMSFRF